MSISKEVETIIDKLKIADISPEEKIERLERIYDMYQFAGDVDAIIIEDCIEKVIQVILKDNKVDHALKILEGTLSWNKEKRKVLIEKVKEEYT